MSAAAAKANTLPIKAATSSSAATVGSKTSDASLRVTASSRVFCTLLGGAIGYFGPTFHPSAEATAPAISFSARPLHLLYRAKSTMHGSMPSVASRRNMASIRWGGNFAPPSSHQVITVKKAPTT